MSDRLPKFDAPPVVETVLGVTFKPLTQWRIPHIGLFWNRVRSSYPDCDIQPPIADEIEMFGPEGKRQVTFTIGPTNMRCWLKSQKGDWLVQVQNSKFITNWRHQKGTPYPNYRGFREKFEKEWTKFKEFLGLEEIGPVDLIQAEVIYVNHIEVDENAAHLEQIFPMYSQLKDGRVLTEPTAVQMNAVFPIPEEKGRLYIAVEPIVRHSDLKQAIQLTLTGRVLIASNSDRDLFEALKLAHNWVVSGFADFTSAKMHELWKRKQ